MPTKYRWYSCMKWKDKRDLMMISTSHVGERGSSNKPKVVEDYNKLKGFVDQSDQLSAYSPFVRRTTKRYLRAFFHFVMQTAVVNWCRLFCDTKGTIQLNEFKMILVKTLLRDIFSEPSSPRTTHKLERSESGSKESRRTCTGCYKELREEKGRPYATNHAKKVSSRCSKCHKYFCMECFLNYHKKCV
ncbi:unnamed protein product [Haemonchus placei]|uniref:PiggyBac transposable element-derived protein domain-containing protein n=1 Tax=Haemonchus placei TaxID=6290 RepID=A0A3P7YZY9_HAEPC|nr:unnamed protein product [Haemonchus placei]